jgi:hypothetical protein
MDSDEIGRKMLVKYPEYVDIVDDVNLITK